MTVEEAKEFLKLNGYYVGNLWQTVDVTSKFDVSEEQAMDLLDDVMQSDYIVSEINDTIEDFGRSNQFKKL